MIRNPFYNLIKMIDSWRVRRRGNIIFVFFVFARDKGIARSVLTYSGSAPLTGY